MLRKEIAYDVENISPLMSQVWAVFTAGGMEAFPKLRMEHM